MRGVAQRGGIVGFVCGLLVFILSGTVGAMQFSSSHYTIDTATLNNVGGYSSSTNYQLTSSGGEAAIGNGASGSYKLAAGYVAQVITPAITVKTQPSGLVAYYPLDENTGTVVHDASSNTNFGTMENGASWYNSGQIGSAAFFNSVGDVHIPYSSALPSGQGLTVESWFRGGSNGDKALVTQWNYSGGSNQGGAWALQKTSTGTGVRFFLAANSSDVGNNYVDTPAGSLPTNYTWHHVVATYDGTQSAANRVKIYIDGVSQSLTTTGSIASSISANTSDLYLGDFHGLNRQLDGEVDQVKLFNRALSAAEVAAEYSAQNTGIEAGLTLQTVTPGASNTSAFDVVTLTSGSSYTLAINQNNDLTNGSSTIPAVSGSIASPVTWNEGTTKGLGFTLVSTNATAIPASWSGGNAYAALPGTATTFYTRTGTQTGTTKDVLGVQLRLDTATNQPSGNYSNTMTITGTASP